MRTWLIGMGSRGRIGLDAGHAARLPGRGLAGAAAPAQAVGLVAVAVELAGGLLLLALAAHLRQHTRASVRTDAASGCTKALLVYSIAGGCGKRCCMSSCSV